MSVIEELFHARQVLIGMIHVRALPGSPRAEGRLESTVETALSEARVYRDAGFGALMIENMFDRPYLAAAAGPEVVAAMTAVGREVRREVALPLGVQVLAGANREALAVALACGATFIRAEAFVFAHVADEGVLGADAGPLLRYRRAIGAGAIRVFADLKKKHAAHAITADVSLVETARAAEFALADGVIVTGIATGCPAEPEDLRAVSAAVTIPTLVGSGISPENLRHYAAADGFIVGSALKQGGRWSNALDPARARAMASAFAELR